MAQMSETMSSAPPTRSVSFKPALRTTFSLSVEPHRTVANRSLSSESSQAYSTSLRGRRQHLRILGERASLGEPSSPNSSMASSPNTATTSTMQTQQSLFSYSSPSRVRSMHGQNFSVDSATYREMLERRKSFRCRGSLGPTVASAPSVEQEDYRTPRPSVSSIKNGKSFDFGGAHAGHSSLAYETNGLVKVSADFLRLNGSRQQFRNLLSARKKLGQMPPAYTRIDYSHDSIESNPARIQHGPVITVEDTGSQINFSFNKGSLGSPVPAPESRHSSLDRTAFIENGNCNTLTVSQPPKSNFIRNNSRYGVPIDESAVKMVYKQRSQRLNTRVQITDRCLVLAIIGIVFMVVDTEMCGTGLCDHPQSKSDTFNAKVTFNEKMWLTSLAFRYLVVFSTLALLIEIVHYHVNEILLDLVDCGADDWRVVLTSERVIQFCVEFCVCMVCPLPWSVQLNWTFIEPSRSFHEHLYSVKEVPVNVLLSLLMLGRVYLLGRFSVLHCKQFQDASTRTLAALNRIQVNFSFVMKTILDQRPLLFLSVFTLAFWVTTAWTFAQCERLGRDEESAPILYSNALWFIAISFMLNGYGDIVPKTNAGRIIAIIVGVIGAIISSILIAVISRKILLSQGQRNVNNFMNDSKLTQRHKDAAARVLQKTWHIYKCLQSSDAADHQLRQHQRKFLEAIHEFRRIKNKIRIFGESTQTSIQQMNRLMTEMHTSMQRLVSAQEEMRAQIEVLQRAMRNHFVSAHAAAVTAANNTPTPTHNAQPKYLPLCKSFIFYF